MQKLVPSGPRYKYFLIFIVIFLTTSLFGQIDRVRILKEFSATNDDSLFLNKYSKNPYQKFVLQRNFLLPSFSPLDSLIFYQGSKGKIIGPLNVDNLLIYIKITRVDSLFRMRAGNLWLSPEKRGKDKIDKLAEDILNTIIRTGDFDAMRKEYSDDSNQNYDADLGWFFQGTMVEEFEKEVLSHKKGDFYIVSTRFGKHIVKTIETPVFDRSKVEYVILYFDNR